MDRRNDSGMEFARKYLSTATGRQVAVQARQIGKAAAEDDDLRVKNVDDAGQRAAEACFVAPERRFAGRVAACGALVDLRRIEGFAGMLGVVARQRWPAQVGLDAATAAAIQLLGLLAGILLPTAPLAPP